MRGTGIGMVDRVVVRGSMVGVNHTLLLIIILLLLRCVDPLLLLLLPALLFQYPLHLFIGLGLHLLLKRRQGSITCLEVWWMHTTSMITA